MSLSLRRAWIEIFVPFDVIRPAMSLSLRRAWIEISTYVIRLPRVQVVALLAESVDRNFMSLIDGLAVSAVALLAESVDRNSDNP